MPYKKYLILSNNTKRKDDAMKLFNFTKKNEKKETLEKPDEHLENGELPFGWTYRNKNFVDKISKEYSYFLNRWIDSGTNTPKERYEALKSFVLYLEDVEKLCKSKGECFEFWFYEILTAPDYLEKRKNELQELTEKMR